MTAVAKGTHVKKTAEELMTKLGMTPAPAEAAAPAAADAAKPAEPAKK
jgi:hypothetical protein